jgi:translation initiation factor IF-3
MIGVVLIDEAQSLAISKNLDLVRIAPQAEPPVCKVMDYGKYLFELSKKEKEAKKNQKVVNLKEVRVSPSIDDHDFEFKVKNACRFLKDGDKVKISVKFRGREFNNPKLGRVVLDRFAEACQELGTLEKMPKLEGKNYTMVLTPK